MIAVDGATGEPAAPPPGRGQLFREMLAPGLPQPGKLDRIDAVMIVCIVGWALFWLAPGLGHPGIHNWDEAMHQAAARGTYDTFFYPHLWADPIWPEHPDAWASGDVWLHKPTLPLWLAAILMKVVGVTPLALRLVSLAAGVVAALCIYLLGRRVLGRFWPALGALSFTCLPYAWRITQGVFFSDAYDTLLAACVALAVLFLVRAVEDDSLRWALLAGLAVGLAHLTKTVLGLAPLGVAGVMMGLKLFRIGPGPRPTHVLAMGGVTLITTGPWNLYCALKWPVPYEAAASFIFGHMSDGTKADSIKWVRPVDAVFNELLATEFGPIPVSLLQLGGLWLLVRAVRKRETAIIACALWVWSTWLAHSYVSTKVPGQVWSAAPGAVLGLALLAHDARKAPVLAGAALAAVFTPLFIGALPFLGRVREVLPAKLANTRSLPGTAEGLVVMLVAAVVAYAISRAARRAPAASAALGGAAGLALLYSMTALPASGIAAQREIHFAEMAEEHMKVVGLALDRALPEKSVLFQDVDHDPPQVFEIHDLLFWSGRMVYRRPPDLPTVNARGYHAYLVTPTAQPFAPVAGVPAHASMRAYDLEAPAGETPLPEGTTPLNAQENGMTVIGWANGEGWNGKDRWVFYVRPNSTPPSRLQIGFVTARGLEMMQLEPELSLKRRTSLAAVPWFVLPVYGPRRADVTGLVIGGAQVALRAQGG